MKVFTKFIVIFYMILLFSQDIFSQDFYTDVSLNDWFYEHLIAGGEYIRGYPDQTFRPNNNISVSEFIAIIMRAKKIEIKIMSFGIKDILKLP